MKISRGFHSLLLAASCLVLAACGGSGSSSATDDTSDGTENGGTGSVAVTLGDNPDEVYDEILLTVSGLELIGDDAPITLLDESITIDLLALDAATELLAIAPEVPAGRYNKLRLLVSNIDLNTLDADGNVETSEQARVLANGRVDLNPRGPFSVTDGGSVLVQLDMDAGRSFKLTQTGSGQTLFRPVVFVDILGDADLQRVSFLHGTINRLGGENDDAGFELCDLRPLTGGGLSRRDECRTVELDDDTAIFDAAAEPIAFGAVDDQSPAVVGGRLGAADDDGFEFEALVVQLGERSEFRRIGGTLQADATAAGFTLIDDEEATLEVSLQSGAVLFDHTGDALELGDLVAGTQVRAMGVMETPEGDEAAATLLATAVSADLREEDDDEVEGVISGIDGNEVTLLDDDGASRCILLNDDTRITVFEADDDGAGSRSGTVSDLAPDLEVEARVATDDDACAPASSLILELDDDVDDNEEEDDAV